MEKYFVICVGLTVFSSCNSWKSTIKSDGGYEIAITNAIIDFSHKNSLAKNDSAFAVDIKEINDEIICVGLLGSVGKFIITKDGKTSRLPNRYLEYEKKLFYWNDKNFESNEEIIYKLNDYNLIDSVETVAHAEFIIDDAKKGAQYYFCKRNLKNYKKVTINKGMGDYKVPKLNCD